ncbi:MAG: hypothetical protein AAFN10_17990, partial [Bacteroidota bacterium]
LNIHPTMKSSIILIFSLLLLASITSCDPFQPLYQDIEGSWELSNITISERFSATGETLADTSFSSLGDFEFSPCDKQDHSNSACKYNLTLPDGRIFELDYQIVDSEDLQITLGGFEDGLRNTENPAGIYDMTLTTTEITLMSQAKSFPDLADAYRGRSLSITLNRK